MIRSVSFVMFRAVHAVKTVTRRRYPIRFNTNSIIIPPFPDTLTTNQMTAGVEEMNQELESYFGSMDMGGINSDSASNGDGNSNSTMTCHDEANRSTQGLNALDMSCDAASFSSS